MTEITSNITFNNKDGQITKCVLQIGGKTFTVTLVNSGYNVVEGGTAPCSTPTPANAATPGSNSSTSTTSTASTASTAPLKPEEYDTPENLIEKLISHGYTAPQ